MRLGRPHAEGSWSGVRTSSSGRESPPLPAGGVQALEGHAEVVMCDFAACMLGELERWMLNASPAMVNLNTFADSSERFITPTSTLEEVSKRIYADEVSAIAHFACALPRSCTTSAVRVPAKAPPCRAPHGQATCCIHQAHHFLDTTCCK